MKINNTPESKWEAIKYDIKQVHNIFIRRCTFVKDSILLKRYLLFCVCDASVKAYAAVLYLHQQTDMESQTSLVFAKTRLAPIMGISVPKLELMAVLIGVRCTRYV